ncbi:MULTISPECIES: integrase catalytic domain-containing protein [Bradyrhizobium]|uniref:Integrase catalytic domain-containing protein n=2 Tax=Bradyrhizobium TaxID=374 RepID=A0ABV4GJR5_9BRAD|nr:MULTISPECIES: DDE-type integrase/transposase/recombinase [Bradyrhizobium]MCA1480714.1 transposase family protein [Bradyrhizobium sp. NBAIM08]MDA9527835.1 integrase [Bradyrhizobium sp. CCBAU 25338]
MAGKISMRAKREITSALAERYRASGRLEKGRILDELCAVAGWHRKHAIRALSADGASGSAVPRRRGRTYGASIRMALIVLWDSSDRLCSKRLVAMIPFLLPALERHGRLKLSADERSKVLRVSAATIDRLLSDVRIAAAGGRRRRAGFSSAVRRQVPVRTFNDWGSPPPGYCEADLVAHGGMSVSGAFIQTLTMVDVATGWTECFPLVVREAALVVEALERAQNLFPWPVCGLDFDNDSAFMNDTVVSWCRSHDVEVTRSRAYKKNDQAFVEQKNGAIVRRLVGYGRFEGIDAARSLARLFAAARLHINFFQPSFKLKEKHREGAKVIKRYLPPATPYERALVHPHLNEAFKRRLREIYRTLDPVALLAQMRDAQNELGKRVDQRAGKPAMTVAPVQSDLTAFARELGDGWKQGEQRGIHRRRYVRRKPAPRRPSMLDPYIPMIEEWLAAAPHLSAVDLLSRLAAHAPGQFSGHQRRTVQRLVKNWRSKVARQLISSTETILSFQASLAV